MSTSSGFGTQAYETPRSSHSTGEPAAAKALEIGDLPRRQEVVTPSGLELHATVNELDSVPERVIHIQTSRSRQFVVPPPGCRRGVEFRNEVVEVLNKERRMRFASWAEIVFDT